MTLIAEISSDIEDFTLEEKKKLDCVIVFDSFNTQISKVKRIVVDEDRINFTGRTSIFAA
jgi:hypothetical protein